MQKDWKDKCIIVAIILLMFIFLFSNNFTGFFKIIKEYIVGELILTYDDFPNIGEWLQIVTSVLFSYLLLNATIKSNEISMRSLDVQEKIIEEQRYVRRNENRIKLSDLQRSIVFYIGELRAKFFYMTLNKDIKQEEYRCWLEQCVDVIEIHGNKIYDIIPEIKDIRNYINLRNKISAYEMDIKNTLIEQLILKEKTNKLINGLLDSLKELNEVIVSEIKRA